MAQRDIKLNFTYRCSMVPFHSGMKSWSLLTAVHWHSGMKSWSLLTALQWHGMKSAGNGKVELIFTYRCSMAQRDEKLIFTYAVHWHSGMKSWTLLTALQWDSWNENLNSTYALFNGTLQDEKLNFTYRCSIRHSGMKIELYLPLFNGTAGWKVELYLPLFNGKRDEKLIFT